MDRNNNFAGVHIVAALMVVVGHEFVLLGNMPPTILGVDIHGLGVRILFLVSGYLVSSSYLRTDSPRRYIWRRLSRLYPPLIICLIVTILFMRLLTTEPELYWQSSWAYFWHNIEMRPKFDLVGIFAENPYPVGVNGSLWTLPIELMCYLLLIPVLELVSILSKFSLRYAKILALGLLLALSGINVIWEVFANGCSIVFWDTDWLRFIPLSIWFLIGAFFYVFEWKQLCNWQAGVVMIILVICLPTVVRDVVVPYIIGYLVLCFSLADKPLFGKLIKRDICYGLYLYAFPVQQATIYLALKSNINLNLYSMLLISIIVTVVLAELSYFVVEEKLDEGVKKLLKAMNENKR